MPSRTAGQSRALLGYADVVSARTALEEMIAWRLANIPDETDTRGWADPFDYALEDEVRRRLDRFRRECGEIEQHRPAVHPYPHPKEPSLAADHRGR